MKSFKEINIAESYTTKDDVSIIESFFNPVLKNSIIYKRAVAYFSSKSLVKLSRGIDNLIENGGCVQIITSPNLTEDDIDSINKGYSIREELANKRICETVNDLVDNYSEVANYLSHLIASKKLDIKIVKVTDDLSALYHAKLGIMIDNFGNKIAFSGSNNETFSGMLRNFETFDVYKEWDVGTESKRVADKNKHFDELWENNDNRFKIYSFSEALQNKLFTKMRTDYIPSSELFSEKNYICEEERPYGIEKNTNICVPDWFDPYDYQSEAVKGWEQEEYKGLYSMATGSGKTLTALLSLYELQNNIELKSMFIVIVVPYIHLIEQWIEDMKEFNINPIVAAESKTKWFKKLKRCISKFNLSIKLSKKIVDSVIVTNATFKDLDFQDLLKTVYKNGVIIFDEVHNAGAEGFKNKLPLNFNFRLGLSATIERHNDIIGTKQIYNYFGKVVQNISMGYAINYGSLVNYFYKANFVYLDSQELEDYKELTKDIARNMSFNKDGETNLSDNVKMLMIKRARILAGAKSKIPELIKQMKEQLHEFDEIKRTLVYCGIVSEYSEDNDEFEKQIIKVNKSLYNEFKLRINKFTSEETLEERSKIKMRFEKNDIDVITAMKCLDEGVNIPQIQHAYILSSSTNPREFIQRRGRVLRKYPDKKYAYINDFIVLPHKLDSIGFINDDELRTELSIIIRELNRVKEFAKYAVNSYEVLSKVDKVYKVYKHLLDEKGMKLYDFERES